METFIASMLDRLLVTSVQAALLAALVWALCRWVPRLPPATQCWLWWLVALQVLVGLCVDPIPLRWLPAESAAAAVVFAGAESTLLPVDAAGVDYTAAGFTWSWQSGVFLLWMTGVAAAAGLTLREWRRTRQLLRSSGDCSDERLLQAFAAATTARHQRAAPRLRCSAHIDSPLVLGHFRPVLLLPATAALSDDELEMAVAHELEHLRRADLWWGFIPVLARHVLFFHPLVHLAAREYGTAREAACDAAVVGASERSRLHYGELLVRLGTAQCAGAGLAAASPTFRALSRRLKLLQHTAFLPRAGSIAVLLLALAFVMPLRLVAAAAGPATAMDTAATPEPLPTVLIKDTTAVPPRPVRPEATPAAQTAAPVDRKAQVIYRPDIRDYYPAVSRSLGEQGTVRLRICSDAAGRVTEATVAESSGFPLLDDAAVKYGTRIRFLAAVKDGVPVGQCLVQPVLFALPAGPAQGQPMRPDANTSVQSAAMPADRKAQVMFRPDIRDVYPAASRSVGEQGTPKVRICIDEAGSITQVTVAESSGFALLDDAAVNYGARMKFRPGVANGVPVAQCFLQSVKFSAADQQAGTQPSSGERITASYQDFPVHTLLQQLSAISGRTIVVDESVTGNVTLRVDNLPWEQVLALVLQASRLEQRVQGNEIVIAAAGVLPAAK